MSAEQASDAEGTPSAASDPSTRDVKFMNIAIRPSSQPLAGEMMHDSANPPLPKKAEHKFYQKNACQCERLKQAYVERQSNFVLISGYVGSGKTTMAMSLKPRVQEDCGYFIKGKLDHFSSDTRESTRVFVDIVGDFCDQVVQRGEQDKIYQNIRDVLQADGAVLRHMIPALDMIMIERSPQEASGTVLSSSGINQTNSQKDTTQNSKFLFALRQLFDTLVASRRIVVFFDDLHHADKSCLDILVSLVTDCRNVFFVCTCRDDLDRQSDPCVALREIDRKETQIVEVIMHDLSQQSVAEMVQDMFNLDSSRGQQLAGFILSDTPSGKPHAPALFVVELLERLHRDKSLYYDKEQREWTWDARLSLGLNGSCGRTLQAQKLSSLPQQLKELLKVASCYGARFTEELLEHSFGTCVSVYLELCLRKRLISKMGNEYIFANDGIQSAAYNLIEDEKREEFHLALGRRLWRSLKNEKQILKHVLLILDQLRRGLRLMTKQAERDAVAVLCLRAGEKAMVASRFRAAANCLKMGIGLLDRSNCWRTTYDLALSIHNAYAECLYVLPDFERMEETVGILLENARCMEDKFRANSAQVLALGAKDRSNEAVEVCLQVLGELGQTFPPEKLMKAAFLYEFHKIRRMLRGKNNATILRMPQMKDARKLGAMNFLNFLFSNSYLSGTYHYPFIGLKMVQLSLRDGLSAVSAFGFTLYGAIHAGVTKNVVEGHRFADLSLQLVEKFQAREWLPRVNLVSWGLLSPWVMPLRESLSPLLEGYQIGLETGDVEYALMSANVYCFNSFDVAPSLLTLRREAEDVRKAAAFHKHDVALSMCNQFITLVDCFRGEVAPLEILQGQSKQLTDRDDFFVIIFKFYHMVVASTHGLYDIAETLAEFCYRQIKHIPFESYEMCQVKFAVAVVLLSVIRDGNSSRAKQRAYLRWIRQILRRIQGWAKHSPNNCCSKQFLIQAELAAIKGKLDRAFAKFTCALSMTETESLLHEHAIGNEWMCYHLLEHRHDPEEAKRHYDKARKTCEDWGAHGKAEHLKKTLGSRFQKIERQKEPAASS